MEELEAVLIRSIVVVIIEVVKALIPVAMYVARRPIFWPTLVAASWWVAYSDHGLGPLLATGFVASVSIAVAVLVRRSAI